MENERKEVQKVDILTKELEKTYDLTKEQALERLKEASVSSSEQMLIKWCREAEIDAIRIAKGAPAVRGIRVSSKSLEAFIIKKSGNVADLLIQIEELKSEKMSLKEELKALRKELKVLKENGVKVEKTKEIRLNKAELSSDKVELTFTYKRATHSAMFDATTGELIEVSKNTKGKGQESVLMKLTEEEKQAIINTRNEEMKKDVEGS